jgi:glutaminyl-peptide cyclotransferase
VTDDHIPFLQAGVPAIDLIDFDFPCWHRRCDDLSIVSARSLDAVGETMIEFLRSL